ncbi:MAG: hypothetical protein ACAI38_06010 [Myxococcota bacterium]|nr:hypothetical protein [Myxococcota bacterium]
MKRSFVVYAPLLLVCACGPKPEETAAKLEATFNANEPEAIMALFADEPFVKVDNESMLNNDEIVSWLGRVLPKKPQMKATSDKSGLHGKLAWTLTIERTDWKSLGLDPLPFKAEAVIDQDKVKMLTLTMDETAKQTLVSTIANRNDRWLAAIQDAVKTRNGPAVLQLVTEDFTMNAPDFKTPVKKAGVAGFVKELEKQNIELVCCSKKNADGTWNGTFASDHYRNDLRLETLEIVSTPTFADDGHIKALNMAWTPASKTKVETAMADGATTAAATKKHR